MVPCFFGRPAGLSLGLAGRETGAATRKEKANDRLLIEDALTAVAGVAMTHCAVRGDVIDGPFKSQSEWLSPASTALY